MTSEDRHKARYLRRRAKREEKKNNLEERFNFDKVSSLNSLDKAVFLASKGVRWKASVQRYRVNKLANVYKTHENLINGVDVRRGFTKFDIFERGKLRHIQAVKFSERVVQKSICKNALLPILTNGMIYDNGASQKGKGTHFAMRRLQKHLERHFRHHGREGGILLIDLHDYFASIDHEKLKALISEKIKDERTLLYTFRFIDAFDKGLGLGSEVSQIGAVFYPNKIDHYIKEVLRIKGYARFMDDSYLIHKDIQYLRNCLTIIRDLYASLGISLNEDKTRICDFKHGFTFLKTRYFITKTGHIIKKPCREAVTRERRKLKKQALMLENKILTFKDIETSYCSWRGAMVHRNARKTIQSMDNLYNNLFIFEWLKEAKYG